MNITPKNQDQIQAEVAEFANPFLNHDLSQRDSAYIFENLGRIAGQPAAPINRILAEDEHGWMGAERGRIMPAGSVHEVARPQDYVDFMRQRTPTDRDNIKRQMELAAAYERFAPAVKDLQARLGADPMRHHQSPDYLGGGGGSAVFKMKLDGVDYAVRVPYLGNRWKPFTGSGDIHGYVIDMMHGRGVPGLEQLQAYSYQDGVTVSEFVPGKTASKLETDEISGITLEQARAVVVTLAAMQARHMVLDPNPGNILYDAKAGFNIIDYAQGNVQTAHKTQPLSHKVEGLIRAVTSPHLPNHEYTSEAYAAEHQKRRVTWIFALKIQKVCQELYPEDTALLELVGRYVERFQVQTELTGNANWVQQQIAAHDERLNQQLSVG